MKKKNIIRLVIFIPLSLFFLYCFFIVSEMKGWTEIVPYFKKKEAQKIIDKIEDYKIKNNRYPKMLSDTGLPEPDESGPFFYYYKDSITSYVLWLSLGFDDNYTYDSRTKKWNR